MLSVVVSLLSGNSVLGAKSARDFCSTLFYIWDHIRTDLLRLYYCGGDRILFPTAIASHLGSVSRFSSVILRDSSMVDCEYR
jgi:hypothetical protein